MGHAGTIIHYGMGTARTKIDALRDAGVSVVFSPVDIGSTMAKCLGHEVSALRDTGVEL